MVNKNFYKIFVYKFLGFRSFQSFQLLHKISFKRWSLSDWIHIQMCKALFYSSTDPMWIVLPSTPPKESRLQIFRKMSCLECMDNDHRISVLERPTASHDPFPYTDPTHLLQFMVDIIDSAAVGTIVLFFRFSYSFFWLNRKRAFPYFLDLLQVDATFSGFRTVLFVLIFEFSIFKWTNWWECALSNYFPFLMSLIIFFRFFVKSFYKKQSFQVFSLVHCRNARESRGVTAFFKCKQTSAVVLLFKCSGVGVQTSLQACPAINQFLLIVNFIHV